MTQTHQQHRPPLLNRRETYTAVTGATYTAKAGDQVVGVNRAGVVTITLPSAEVRPGRIYTVKDESGAAASNNITVATEGSETIDGSATHVLSTNYQAVTYYSDGADWFVVPVIQPTAHEASHNSGGSDDLKLDNLASPDDNTDLDFSTSAHGLVPKGTNTGDFLKDDGSWDTPPSATALLSTILSGSRLASAGNGDQALTGAGFQPTTILILAMDALNSDNSAWGFGDDALAEAGMTNDAGSYTPRTNELVRIDTTANNMKAVIKTLDSDGLTLTWSKTGSGYDVDFKILCLR